MKNKMSWTCFGLLAFGAASTVIGAIIQGYVFVKLWQWFAVPVFGFEPIKLVPAIGIGMLVSYLTHQNITSQKDREILEMITSVIGEIFYSFIVLFAGWVVSLFMA